jgi:hypothetical protein
MERYSHISRLSQKETNDVIAKIPLIHNLFRDLATEEEDYNEAGAIKVGKIPDDEDNTESMMYLSRYKDLMDKNTKEKSEKNVKSVTETEGNQNVNQEFDDAKYEQSNKITHNLDTKRKFCISLATLSSKSNKRKAIVKEGAIAALLDMSTIKDNIIERCCATAFAYLSLESSLRIKMLEEGVFSTLTTLGNSVSRQVKSMTAITMCNLCCEMGFESKLLKEGAAVTILHISLSCTELLDTCLKSLLNLSCIPDKYSRVEDITEAIMYYVGTNLSLEQDELIMCTITNLSSLRNNQLRIVEDGCLKFVDRFIKSSLSKLRLMASQVIRNLSTDYRTRSKLIENNIISTLITMSKDEDEYVKTECVRTFYNLAKDVNCCEKIVQEETGSVAVILRMSMDSFSKVELGQTSARLLRVLSSDSATVPLLVSKGIVRALQSLLRTDDRIIQQNCAEAICYLFQLSRILSIIIEQGAVDVLVTLAKTSTDSVTAEWCSFAIYHLAINVKCPAFLIERDILPCVIKLCQNTSERTKYFSSAALAYITNLKSVKASDSIPLLVKMLYTDCDVRTKSTCASALYNMVDVDENCYLMLEEGILVPVVELITSENMQTKMKCAAILSRLSLHKNYYVQFAAEGVLRVLLELSCVDHILTQRRVVIAISNLSQNQGLRLLLLELKPIPYIISLASKRDENLRRGCASIVCNLACEVGNEKSIVNAGIVPILLIIAMITSDQVSCKIICVKAIINLMADKSLYKVMVKEGIIWGISTLALCDNDELLWLCAKALYNISCDFAKEMLQSQTTIKMVMKLIQHKDIELLRAGSRVLTNLLLKTNDENEDFRRYSVENMLEMAQCKDPEVCEMCILCLCLASQAESCRECIVEKELHRMIDTSTIFSQSRVCYAYLTMFGNIANNPAMRVKLLDDRSVDRFLQICVAGDQHLDLAVVKALYCVSCSPGNIMKLANQDILRIVKTIWFAPYDKTREIVHHIVALLYNICTFEAAQALLVSQGIIEQFKILWSICKKDKQICTLVCSAVTHLASGNVNTARIVSEGGTDLLCFMTKCKRSNSYSTYHFPLDIHMRAAASIRNLLCVVTNQQDMVKAGCIDALISMAKDAQEGHLHVSQSAIDKRAKQNRQRKVNTSGDNPESDSICNDCAAALRSMTFNTDIRDILIKSGAMDVILLDLRKSMSGDDIGIAPSLLSQLEEESWQNGSRSRQKEGRAKKIPSANFYVDLLRGTENVELDVEIKFQELQKFHVQVQLDEPIVGGEGSLEELELGIKDLTSFDDLEDVNTSQVMICSKVIAQVPSESIQSLFKKDYSLIEDDSSLEDDLDSSTISEPKLTKDELKKHHKSTDTLPDLKSLASSSQDDKSNIKSNTNNILKLPPAPGPNLSSSVNSSLNSSMSKSSKRRKPPEDKFQNLISLISNAKRTDGKKAGANIDDVVNQWRNLSRF